MSTGVRGLARAAWVAFGVRAQHAVARLRSAIIGPNVRAVLVECPQGRFLARPDDWTVGGALARNGSYGLPELERLLALTTPQSRVLVVGTHIGALAIPLSRRVAHLTAVEANPDTFELLRHNVLLNGCENVELLQLAASDRAGELEFVLNTSNSGGSKRLPLVRRGIYFHDQPKVVRVRADRLDDVLAGNYDVILMDIEGSEYFALQGMSRLISQARHLASEFLPHHFRDVAGVTAKEFVKLVEPHFDQLFIPTRNATVPRQQFLASLTEMFERDEGDEGIVFSKN